MLELSPLRGRRKDIIDIGERLLAETCQRLNKPGLVLGEHAKEVMLEYHWPGNVRELSNAIERAVILADDGAVITQSLLAIEPTPEERPDGMQNSEDTQTSLEDYFVRFVQENEQLLTETELAAKLGISRKSLWGTPAAPEHSAQKDATARTARIILKQMLKFFRRKKAEPPAPKRIRDHQLGPRRSRCKRTEGYRGIERQRFSSLLGWGLCS